MAKNKLYSCDIVIYATVYVKAQNAAQACERVQALQNDGLELDEMQTVNGIPFSRCMFNDPAMPRLSLSPAMSISAEDIRSLDEDDFNECD